MCVCEFEISWPHHKLLIHPTMCLVTICVLKTVINYLQMTGIKLILIHILVHWEKS